MAEPVAVEFPDRQRATLPSCPRCDRHHDALGIQVLPRVVHQDGTAYNGYVYCPRTEARVLVVVPSDVLDRWDAADATATADIQQELDYEVDDQWGGAP